MHAIRITNYVASSYLAALSLVSRGVTWALVMLVRGYQFVLGGILGGHCRFQPTCSNYALDVLRNCGPLKGSRLALWRILRCNPFCKGGYDPAPGRPGE